MSKQEIVAMLEDSIGGDEVIEAWELPNAYVFVVDTGETEFDPMLYRLGKSEAIPTAIDQSSDEMAMVANNRAKRIK